MKNRWGNNPCGVHELSLKRPLPLDLPTLSPPCYILHDIEMQFASRILTASLILPHVSTLAAKCYNPDGSLDDNDVPCFADDGSSRCCAPDEVCSTNKLCVSVKNGVNSFSRRSCLDASFGGTCPDFCTSSRSLVQRHGPLLTCYSQRLGKG